MSKYRILFIYNVVLVAIMASGFIFSWPTFTGTIFPFLGVCFQFAMLLVLFVMILRFKRQRRMREAE